MRLIGQLSKDHADAFTDVLYLRGIDCELSEAPSHRAAAGPVEVWVLDEDRVAEARALFSRFIALPASPEFRDAPAQAAARRATDASRTAAAARDLSRRAAPALAAFSPSPPYVTHVLLLFAVASAVLLHFVPAAGIHFRPIPEGILSGRVWMLVLPSFRHPDIWQLLLMLFWFHDLGAPLERHLGHRAFFALAFSLVVIPNLAQSILAPDIPTGLSPLVYGLLAFTWLRARRVSSFRPACNPYTPWILLLYLAFSFFPNSLPLPLHAIAASVLSGLLLALFPSR